MRWTMLLGFGLLAATALAQDASLPAANVQPVTAASSDTALSVGYVLSGPIMISYQNGQLALDAQNASLIDLLHAISSQTGALFDIPPAADERVVVRLGPGKIQDVLAAFLNGSHFNYVFIGSAGDPNRLAQVILSPRTASKPVSTVAVQPGGTDRRTSPPVPGQTLAAQQQPRQQLAQVHLPSCAGCDGNMGGNVPNATSSAEPSGLPKGLPAQRLPHRHGHRSR